MHKIIFFACLFLYCTFSTFAEAHEINYVVENKGICAKFFYSEKESLSYAEYEIFAPSEKYAFAKGRTDKNGVVCFLPDRTGKWIVNVREDTEHGLHAAKVEITVNEKMLSESFSKPLVAQHTKFFIALGFVGWMIGILAILKFMKKRN